MEQEILDNFTIYDRLQSYYVNGENHLVNFNLSGHCDKRFVRVNDNSIEFEKRFDDSLNLINKESALDRFKKFLQSCVLGKKAELIEYVGSKDLAQKTIKDSVIFADLFKSMIDGESSFFTYFQDLITDGEVYIPHYISSLEKECDLVGSYNECVGSRLANLFGVDVVYNTSQDLINKKNKLAVSRSGSEIVKSKLIDSNYARVYSVDFVLYGYDFESIEWFVSRDIVNCDCFETVCERFEDFIIVLSNNKRIDISENKYRELECQLLKQIFVKKFVFQDGDLENRNFGVLFNRENQDIKMAPMFDMEYLFTYSPSEKNSAYMENLRHNIEFFYNRYPQEFEKMYQNIINAVYSGAVSNVIKNTFPNNEKYKRFSTCAIKVIDWVRLIKKQFSNIKNSHKEHNYLES